MNRRRLVVLLGLLAVTAAAPLGAATSDNPPPGVTPPVSQVLFVPADHSAWTRFDRDGNQPLTLTVVGPDLVLAGFSGGYLLLKADLSLLPVSLNFLGRSESVLKNASPWAAAWTDQTAVLLDNQARTLALVYPEEGLVFTQEQKLPDLSHFNAVPGKRIALYQSRKAWTMDIWPRQPYPDTPLNFFPAEVKTGPDGKPWGLDLINGRIWAVEDGFWTPQAEARSPTKPTSMAGGLRGIFFLAGPGWLGCFDSEGQRLWLWDKDLAGNPLPSDPRLTSGPQGLYLLSASGQRLWFFAWSKLSAPAKRVVPPAAATVFGWVDQRLGQLTDQLHYPEAEALAGYGLAYGEDQLRSDPFNPELRSTLAHLKALRSDLREARVGFGSLSLRWDLHTGVPYADWDLKADQSAATGPLWFKSLTQWRPGLPTPTPSQEGPLPRTVLATTWPSLPELKFAKAYYPGLVEILLTHPDSGQRAYFRFTLPYPNLPEPPDDRPQVPGLPSRGSALGGQ